MLRELEASKAALGVSSYGLAETTLEEVFLAVTRQRESAAIPATVELKAADRPEDSQDVSVAVGDENGESRPFLESSEPSGSAEFDGDLRRPTRVLVGFPASKVRIIHSSVLYMSGHTLCACLPRFGTYISHQLGFRLRSAWHGWKGCKIPSFPSFT